MFAIGKAGLHQPPDVVGVHYKGDRETETLEGNTGADHRDCGADGLLLCDDGGDSTAKHDREDGKDPRRHHSLEVVGVGCEDKVVLNDCEGECAGTVDPEEGLECKLERFLCILAEELVEAGDDSRNGKPESREEEALSVVTKRVEKTSMEYKSK